MSSKDTAGAPPGAAADAGTDLGAAGAQLSTAPVEDLGQAVPGSFGGVRKPGTAGALAWTGREAGGGCAGRGVSSPRCGWR